VAAVVGSSRKVADSALCRVSLVVQVDDHCVVERTYLHGLDHIGSADDVQLGNHSVPLTPALAESRCIDLANRPLLSSTAHYLWKLRKSLSHHCDLYLVV
jgi:hypothetical protein